MKRITRLSAACVVGAITISQLCAASPLAEAAKEPGAFDDSVRTLEKGAPIAKSASAQTLGSRATVTSSATLYGGFEISNTAVVYILVRGNSLGTLGVTQNYLDLPRVRIYNAQGQDLVFAQNGSVGFNFCLSTNTVNQPVYDYYRIFRGGAPHGSDACYAATFAAGVYTFSVTPSIPGVTTTSTTSIPSFGEVLFEITLGP